MAVQGLLRKRAHQFGRQAVFGTPHAASRRYPFTGTPDVNLNWTDPQVDAGALITVASPFREAPTIAANLTVNALYYNDLPLLMAGTFGGGEAGSGAGPDITWAWDPNMETPDDVDVFTYEFGDDVLTDWFQLTDGTITQLTINSPEEGAGVLTASANWTFMNAQSTGSTDSPVTGTVPTPSLSIDIDGTPVYLKDCSIFIDSTAGAIGSTQITDALHNFTLTITKEYDQKRYANGTQSFGADAVAVTGFTIELACQFAKTSDTVGTGSEADAWMSDTAVNRYVKISFESTREADVGTPYSWDFQLPLRYYTRADGAIGGNTTVTLTGHAFLDSVGLDSAFSTTVVNTLHTAYLGANPS